MTDSASVLQQAPIHYTRIAEAQRIDFASPRTLNPACCNPVNVYRPLASRRLRWFVG